MSPFIETTDCKDGKTLFMYVDEQSRHAVRLAGTVLIVNQRTDFGETWPQACAMVRAVRVHCA